MNKNPGSHQNHLTSCKSGAALVVVFIAFALLVTRYGHGQAAHAAVEKSYVPLAVTSSRTGPPPVYQEGIELEGALCPNDIAVNDVTGNVYIANEFSDNVSIVKGTEHLANIATGTWPARVESDPLSATVYVSHIVSGITVLDGDTVSGQIDAYSESFDITVNTVNGYTYVTDLGRPITVIRGNQKVTDLFVPDYEGHQIQWQLASAFDEMTGLTYFANWEDDVMTVVDGLEVVEQFPYVGQGANDIAIDSRRRLMYVANLRAHENGPYRHNISIIDLETHEVTPISTAEHSRSIAIDRASGYVYVTNTSSDSVTVLRGRELVATYGLGREPRGVAVDPASGFAYVANSGELSVTVLRDGLPVTNIELPPGQGFRPYALDVDPQSKRLLVVNRSSVVKHDTNMVPNRIECRPAWLHILQ